MTAGWHFKQFRRGDTLNDPIQRAFFSQESVSGHAAASIVRESIQNSLDARPANTGTVKVVFTLRTAAQAAASTDVSGLYTVLGDHLRSQGAGLESPPAAGESVPYLAIEDFGTTGLTGDPAQWNPTDAELGPFFLFFRALGRSGKHGDQRGRWGVGKFVFPLASRANTWFGLSVTAGGGPPVLMGRALLKTHGARGETWHPDGYWGLRDGIEGIVLPTTPRNAEFDHFRRTFELTRRGEPGLSVVVPWVRSDITGPGICGAVVREYFLPIIRRELVVVVDQDRDRRIVDAETIEQEAERLDDPIVSELIELAMEAVTIPQSQIHQLHRADADGGPAWNDSLVPETERLSLSDALDAGRAVAVRVPLMVRRRNVSPELSHFDLFVKRSRDGSSSAPLLLREGISIPEAKMKRVHGHAVLVVVDHSPLAALVGDAENPSHTQLLHEELKDKYVRGKMVLSLIRESSAGLVRALAGGSTEDDPFLFASLFPMSEAGTGRVQKPTTRPGHNAPKLAIETRSPARFRVNRVIGGFSIKGITETEDPPEELLISVAYEVRRGNPLKKYQPFDFAMSQGDIATVVDGAELKECRENRLRVVPQRSDFSVVVSGFDPNRNLFIRVN